jgi:hypothetical protein
MEWINDYWYVLVLGLVGAMFLFGHRTKKGTDTIVQDEQQQGSNTRERPHKSGHGCCG